MIQHLPGRAAKLVAAVLLALGLLALSTVVLAQEAGASALTVTNCHDSGPGSLRAAVLAAASGDAIDLGSSCPVITLTSGPILVTTNGSLTINGPGAAHLAVTGNHATTVFWIGAAAKVTISDLTIEHGRGSFAIPHGPSLNGGGVFNFGSLTINDSIVTDNAAPGSFGGGIYNGGILTVNHSSVASNTAGAGGIGGGILNADKATVSNSQLTNNVGGSAGGAIYNGNPTAGGLASLTVANSTLKGNSSPHGSAGGIYNLGTVTITVCTVSNNTAASSAGAIESASAAAAVNISGSTFSGNTTFAGDVEPGIDILEGSFTVKSTTFT